MACFATSSFHEESGPVCVALGLLSAGKAGMAADINAAVAASNDKPVMIRLRFICLILMYVEREFHISDGECRCEAFR
jgi:hypothetical protein